MSVFLKAVRRLATVPPFSFLTRVAPLMRISYALRSSLVHEQLRFVGNELRRGPVTATYRLRESGIRVTLRHHTGDIMVLDEIFSQREYDFPDPVAQALAAAAHPLHVVDLGANIGLFGAWILGRFPDARIVGFEADPANAAVHRATIEANRDADSWRLIEAFAAPRAGRARFAAGEHATSHESHGDDAIDVEAVDLFEHARGVDFLKVDVEGSEWPLLADPRFAELPARAVVLEYHTDGCPAPDPAAAAEEALIAAGYDVVPGQTKPTYGAGIVWGVRRSAQSSP